jgi:hypothetical protein
VEEILKVMAESLPLKLSPLEPQLMKLLLKKEEPAAIKKPAEKRRRIITVIDAIEETPSSASASKHQLPKLLPPKLQLLKLRRPKPQILRAYFLILIR